MKKRIFIIICIIGFMGFSSCGSTRPCGLANKTKQIKKYQPQIMVAEVTVKKQL